MSDPNPMVTRVRPGAPVAAASFMLGAAAIHVAVVPEHLREYRPFGWFFLAVALFQGLLAAGLLGKPRSRPLVMTATVGNLALCALFLVSRTVGVPIGPSVARAEPWDTAGIICSLLEVVAAGLLATTLITHPAYAIRTTNIGHRRWRRRSLVLAAGLAAVLTAIGAAAAAAGRSDGGKMPAMGGGSPTVSVAGLREAPGNQPVRRFTLVAEAAVNGDSTVWTYNGTVPGPELRVTQGDRVRVTLVNHLDVPTTIHWHGLSVPNAEDGVPGVTQDAVPPGHSYVYEFVARDTGTYWYHSHEDALQQISHGLFGALVVEPPGGHVPEQRDYVAIMHRGGPGAGAATVEVNGQTDLRLDAAPGQTVRLRLVDAVAPGMAGTPEAPVLYGAPYRVVALDGHELNGPQDLPAEKLTLGMGQRADVVFTMPTTGAVELVTGQASGPPRARGGAGAGGGQGGAARGGPTTDRATVTIGSGPTPAIDTTTSVPQFDPTRYGRPTASGVPTEASHFDADFPIVLSEQPGFNNGRPELVHMINGKASPDGAMFQVHTGWLVKMHIVNDTAEWHPMHLHGHLLTVLSVNGQAPQGSPVRLDTVLVGPHETWDVAFLADNPGIWMLHCHVLLHAAMGMNAMVAYTNVTTPYRPGGAADNNPDG